MGRRETVWFVSRTATYPQNFLPSIVGVVIINDTHELNEIFLLYNFGDAVFRGCLSKGRGPRCKAL
jgi:hypothetical protein